MHVEERIVAALADGPLSTRELEDRLRQEIFDTFVEEAGLPDDWQPNGPERAVALAHAEQLGLEHLRVGQGYRKLLALERAGRVARIQIEGHRPMLWRLA